MALMRARAFLDAAARLPAVGLETLLGERGAVVVAPHPDDESLGCGSLIAKAVALKRDIRVVIVSDGVGSHPSSKAYPSERLRALRESEAGAAAHALGLGPQSLRFLRLPDRFVPSEGPDADNAAHTIAEICRQAKAGALFVTWRHDPHCDHQASYAIACAALRFSPGVRLFEYSVWGRSLPPDAEVEQEPRGYRLSGSAHCPAKQAAIACHQSQVSNRIKDDPGGFRLSAEAIAGLIGAEEVFLEAEA